MSPFRPSVSSSAAVCREAAAAASAVCQTTPPPSLTSSEPTFCAGNASNVYNGDFDLAAVCGATGG